jgi:hypothetical protein
VVGVRDEGKQRLREMRSTGTAYELAPHVWVLLLPEPMSPVAGAFVAYFDVRGSEDDKIFNRATPSPCRWFSNFKSQCLL